MRAPRGKRYSSLLFCSVIAFLLFSGCTTLKILFLNVPTVNDLRYFHHKEIAATSPMDPFIPGKNYNLPGLSQWVVSSDDYKNKGIEYFLKKTKTKTFIIVRNDTILYENYFHGHSKTKPEIIFSISKSFVTSLVPIAIKEGFIKSIDEKVSDFIPEFKNYGKGKITLRDALNMTTGLEDDDYRKIPKTARLYYTNSLGNLIKNAKMNPDSTSSFIYKSIDTQILGMCIEKATGKDITEYLKEKIWTPLHMEYNAYFTLDRKNGEARMYGGLAACGRDLLKLARLYLNRGEWDGKQIIPQAWVDSINTKKIKNKGWWGYTCGWWLDTFLDSDFLNTTDYYAAGFKGQCLYVNPENKIIILRLGKSKGGIEWESSISHLAKIISIKNTQEVNKQSWVYFPGTYTLGNKTLIIDHSNGKWTMQEQSGEKETRMIKLEQYCYLSLYNFSKFTRLIFKMQDGKVAGLYYDDCSHSPVYYEKKQ